MQALAELLGSRTDWTLTATVSLAAAMLGPAPELAGLQAHAIHPGLRMRGRLSLAFPPRELDAVRVDEHPRRGPLLELDCAHTTLYGVGSPLSPLLTEDILHQDDAEARERVRRFLDIFNHRILELLVRADLRARPLLAGPGGPEAPLPRVLAELQARPPRSADIPGLDEALAPFGGLLYQRARGLSGLEQLLRACVPWPTWVEPGVPRLVRLCEDDRSGLGTATARLAQSLVLGERVWDCGGSFRVCVGPLPPEAQAQLRPDGELHRRVEALVSLWCTEPVVWELEVHTTPRALGGMRLSARAPQSRLGESSWLGEPDAAAVTIVLSGGRTSQAVGGYRD